MTARGEHCQQIHFGLSYEYPRWKVSANLVWLKCQSPSPGGDSTWDIIWGREGSALDFSTRLQWDVACSFWASISRAVHAPCTQQDLLWKDVYDRWSWMAGLWRERNILAICDGSVFCLLPWFPDVPAAGIGGPSGQQCLAASLGL